MGQSPRSPESPAEHDSGHAGPSVVASRYGTLWALDARDGSILWRLTPIGRHPTLIHAGDLLYTSSHIPLAAFKDREDYNGTPIPPGHPRRVVRAHPAEIAALRITDGTPIWQQEGWSASTNAALFLDGDLLFSEGPVEHIGDVHIHALDARTGAIRWTHDAGPTYVFRSQLLGAGVGRVLVLHRDDGPRRRLDVLDAQTGAILRSQHVAPDFLTTKNGAFVAMPSSSDDAVLVYASNDSSEIGRLPKGSRLLTISDDGIAYVAGHTPKPRVSSAHIFSGHAAKPIVRHLPIPTISAVRLSDGTELWRTEHVEAGTIVTTANALYSARLTNQERGEVLALDIHTGKILWRWQTPGNLLSLLRLWGSRLPQVLIHAIAQARRSFIRARDNHDGGIIRREILNGQWRRPTHLISYIGVHLAAHPSAVYLATSLGLFALHPRDGHLLWHALPTSELVQIVASPASS